MPTHTPPPDLSPALSPRIPAWLLLPQLRRGLLIGLLIHTVVWGLQVLPYPQVMPYPVTFAVGPLSALLIIATTGVLALIDARIMREPLFYASLGVPRWLPAAAGAMAAGVMEIVISALW